MVKLNKHITNINRALNDNRNIAITTNKVATNLDLNIIEKYIKNIDEVDTNKVMSTSVITRKVWTDI